MKCDHATVQPISAVSWCPQCGAIRVDPNADWRLPASEQREVQLAEMCPICEFGDPFPVEDNGDHKIWRWSCGHWIDSRTAEKLRREGTI
jgi:hypothetical protein